MKDIKIDGTNWNGSWVASHEKEADFLKSAAAKASYPLLKAKDRESLLSEVYKAATKGKAKAEPKPKSEPKASK